MHHIMISLKFNESLVRFIFYYRIAFWNEIEFILCIFFCQMIYFNQFSTTNHILFIYLDDVLMTGKCPLSVFILKEMIIERAWQNAMVLRRFFQ